MLEHPSRNTPLLVPLHGRVDRLDLLRKFLAFVPGLEIRVFDKAIVYCVDIRVVTVALFFVRCANIHSYTGPDFQSGELTQEG